MPQVVEVRFKGNRKAYFEWHEPEPLRVKEAVLVETDRGLDLGRVGAVGRVAELKCERCTGCAVGAAPEAPGDDGSDVQSLVVEVANGDGGAESPPPPRAGEGLRRVVRRATTADVRIAEELRRGEEEVRQRIRERVATHGLVMKVSDAEWQWDRKRLSVYFTADKRVDFRNLVRDLASLFRTRIELRQIGVRDEAVRLDGIGRCGRRLCSASFLTELRPIGLQIAKDQRLSLNPSQISGPCGRLLCCLRFEHDFYVQSRKRFPKEHKTLQTARGAEKVLHVNIFKDLVTLRAEDGTSRTVALADLRSEIERGPAAPPAATAPAPEPSPAPSPPPRQEQRRRRERRHRPGARVEGPATPEAGGSGEQPPAAPAEPARPHANGRDRRRRRRRGRRRQPPPTP